MCTSSLISISSYSDTDPRSGAWPRSEDTAVLPILDPRLCHTRGISYPLDVGEEQQVEGRL